MHRNRQASNFQQAGKTSAAVKSWRSVRRRPKKHDTAGGLKPVEQEAWLAMARRQGASGGMKLASFYPERYREAFVVEGEGVRVAVRPVGGSDVGAQIENGQVIYREAYPETNSVHVVGGGAAKSFSICKVNVRRGSLRMRSRSERRDARELVNGEVHFTDKAGRGVKIEAPWVIEANGALRTDAVHWELDAAQPAGGQQRLRLLVAAGLRYPLVIDPSWTATGRMGTARDQHTATLLPNGKVLVAGGKSNSSRSSDHGFLSSAEVYDPATGSWSSTSNLVTPRALHTATLLPNGKVLVAGGRSSTASNNVTVLRSAEVYDPAAGTWSVTGMLHDPRTLTRRRCCSQARCWLREESSGNVSWTPMRCMIRRQERGRRAAAGISRRHVHVTRRRCCPLARCWWRGWAQQWIPRAARNSMIRPTGTWSNTGSLDQARFEHTATLLPTGKVLVAGGATAGCFLSSAELYDPATGSWSSTGTLGTARVVHTATLLPSARCWWRGDEFQRFS